MPASGGLWDLINKKEAGLGQPGVKENPAAGAVLAQGPVASWDPKASFMDLYKMSMKQFLSGGYQTGYDIMDYLAKNRPQELKNFDAATGDPLNTPAARLYKRLKVQLNIDE